MCVRACACVHVCVSLVCHSEPCPYVTKHNHVLFILERMRGGQQSLSKGWREQEREGRKEGGGKEGEENWWRENIHNKGKVRKKVEM